MKTWMKQFEWQDYSNCQGDSRFLIKPGPKKPLRLNWWPGKRPGWIGRLFDDNEPVLSDEDAEDVERRCWQCRVRPECIQHALDNEMSSVWCAGVYLPDPAHGKALRSIHERLRGSLPDELAARGEDV